MPNGIIDLSLEPVRLRSRLEQLVLVRDGVADVTIPFDEIAVLVVAHPQVSFTQAVVASVVSHGGSLVICDHRSLPIGMLLPIAGHHLTTRRITIQIGASVSSKKRAWKQIIVAKIKNQGAVLQEMYGADAVSHLASRVKSGDPQNVEAHAAKVYWHALFPAETFRRRHDGNDTVNAALNYGYAILRAVTARALCAAGLHPALGVHHRNITNPYCLADDLMEPFRPVVDRSVLTLLRKSHELFADDAPLSTDIKRHLIENLTTRYAIETGEGIFQQTLFETLSMVVASLVGVLDGTQKELNLPRSL